MSDHNETPNTEERGSAMERHAQTIIATGILLLCAWILSTVSGTSSEIAALSTKITEVQSQVRQLDDRFAGYLPNPEAQARFEVLRAEINGVSRRLDYIESRNRVVDSSSQARQARP